MSEQKDINRREFLKRLGIGTAATSTALAGCDRKNHPMAAGRMAQGEVPTDSMSYRTNPKTGEKVSVLGYGCMRWPMKPVDDGNGEVIDQEAVNELIDYALAHGINYFDTAPPHVCTARPLYGRGVRLARRYGADHAEIPLGPLYGVPVLYAVSLRTGHFGYLRSLQQVH